MSNEQNMEALQGGIQENVYVEDIVSITTQIDEKGVAILFTFIDDETSVLEAAITDNYVETNYAQQDHIAIKPRIYRLRGCVGEVVYKGSSEWNDWISNEASNHPVLQKTLDFLQPILAVSGVVNSAVQSARRVIDQLESSYNKYKKMVQNLFTTRQNQLTGQMQETVVADLNRILELRVPVNLKGLKFEKTLDKGNNYKRTYYLQSVSAHQGSNNFISDIEVTIKEFRIATTEVVALDPQQYGAFKIDTSATQKNSEVNEGVAAVQEVKSPIELAEGGWKKADTIQAPQEFKAQEGQLLKPNVQRFCNNIKAQWQHRNDYKNLGQDRDVLADLNKLYKKTSNAFGKFQSAYGLK